MYLVGITPPKGILDFYENLHSCNILPTDEHVQNLEGEIIQLVQKLGEWGGIFNELCSEF